MLKKTYVIFVLFLCCPSFVQAGDLSKLVEKRISQDGTTLNLTGLKIGKKGAKKLATIESLDSLDTLHLQGNNIKSYGMKALARSPHLINLKHIDLWGNLLGDLGLKAIADSPHLKSLETLKPVSYTHLTLPTILLV